MKNPKTCKMLPYLAIAMSLTLVACGGGSGGSGGGGEASSEQQSAAAPSTTTPVVSTPTPATVNSEAGNSKELQVEPDFKFTGHKTIKLDVSVRDIAANGRSGILVRFYSIPDTIEKWTDQHVNEKSLVFSRVTDFEGNIKTDLEVPQLTKRMLIKAQAIGLENHQLVYLEENTLAHVFQQ